jgi:hypothetical protein
MTTDLSMLPLRIRRKVGLSPWATFIIWAIVVGLYWMESQPGAEPIRVGRAYATPKTHEEFLVIAVVTTAVWLVSLAPIFPVMLDIDADGIKKTFLNREHFYPWSEIADLRVTETGGFRGRGGTIRFIRPGEIERKKPVDLSPGMFGSNATELASVIRQGIDRWGPQGGVV